MRRIIFLALLFCLTLPNLAQENNPTPYEIALQRIEAAEASGTDYLDLSNLGLTELPPEIGNLSNLQNLNLGENKLANLPPEIGNLSNLIQLNLSGNQLMNFPSVIGNLTNLQYLSLSQNSLTSLPSELASLSDLCSLILQNNQIQYLPTELSKIQTLQAANCGLILYDNPLISPPAEVIAQGTAAILDYLENEAWWHLQRLIVGGASSFGLVATIILGIRWRQRGKQKKKNTSG